MAGKSRSCMQTSEWDSHYDYNDSLYDPQYADESIGGGVNLDHCRLYITNIPRGLNEDGLGAAFSKFGTLLEVHLSKDPSKKYGLIRFETPEVAKLAMMQMNKTEPLKLNINIAHRSNNKKVEERIRNAPLQDRLNNVSREKHEPRQSYRDDTVSVVSRSRPSLLSRPQDTFNRDNMETLLGDDGGFSDILDPRLTLELENLKMEQLKLKEEQLQCKHRMLILKQHDRAPQLQSAMSNRCVLPDGKIVVHQNNRNADMDFGQSAGAGDSNETTICCSCKSKAKSSWEPQTERNSSTSTCILCSVDPSDDKLLDKLSKSKNKKSKYLNNVTDSKRTAPSKTVRKSDCSKVTGSVSKITSTISKKSDVTSKKEMQRCGKRRSDMTCDLKYSDFYTDNDDEDETNRLIQLRNNDYVDIVDEDLKLVIALAGYPKSKMKLRQMEHFQRSLSDVIDMQLKAGLLKKVPSFLDYYLNRGALVCICKDGETKDWMVRVSPGLQERMRSNLVLLKAKVKRLCLAILKIPCMSWPATAQDTFKLLQYFNPMLKTNCWKIYAQKLVDDVEYTSFLIDRVSGEIIRGPSFKNVIDYSQMEFELTGYTEIYYECLLSGTAEDLRSVSSRVKLLDELRSTETTPRNESSDSVKTDNLIENNDAVKVSDVEKKEEIEVAQGNAFDLEFKKELESGLPKNVLKKLKDIRYISTKDEILVWSDEMNNNCSESDATKLNNEKMGVGDNNVTSQSGVAISDKTESFIESNDNLLSRSSNLNIDSNRGIAYHRRTNYLHVEPELKVAITLEGYPQNKLEGTHIRRLKHLFKEYLHKDMKIQRFANLIIPKFQDIYLSNGAVIYICDSLETKDYLTEVLPKFINSTGLKLTFKDIKSLVRYTRIVMRIPKEHAHVESLEILMKLQKRYSGLKPDCWKYYSDVAGKQKRQFGVDPDSLEIIKNPDFDPTYEGEKLIFRIIDRQKRDISFEELKTQDINNIDAKRQRDLILKNIYVPIDLEIMAMTLTRIRTNHYSDLIPDDLKLYVGPSNYPESRVDEIQFHTIKRTVENLVLESLAKDEFIGEGVPKFHDLYLFDGVIFIICATVKSRNWLEQALVAINSRLHLNLKATEFRGAVGIISMTVKTEKSTDEVIAILQEQNPRLRTKYWRKISTVHTKSKLDVVLQIDKLSAEVITGQNFNKFIGTSAVQFKLGHLQSLLKPMLTLEALTKVNSKRINKNNSEMCSLNKHQNSMEGTPKKSFEDLKSELKQEHQELKPEIMIAKPDPTDHKVCDLKIDEVSGNVTNREELSMGDQKVFFYSKNKVDTDLDPMIIESDSPRSVEMPEHQDYYKIMLTIPSNILPESKDDLNIIFDLLEDKNPGLNTELWQIFAESAYPNNGKFTVYVDKQSMTVLQGEHFDPFIGGEKLKFYF